ncbi:MAG: thioredoxin-disulfide reductase [Thermoplasmatota archaeon]
MSDVYDCIIIGSGPAGCTAAIYSSRAYLKTLVIAGFEAGGQLMLTSDVENFPGYAEGIGGPEMMQDLRKQAERFGATFIEEDADEVDFTNGKGPHTVTTMSGTYTGKTVIVATGSSAKWLGIESEQKLMGRGVSACATCDGFFFKDKDVIVVGGGDTAMEEATFLTKYASKVTIVHRRDEFRASKIMAKRAMEHPKIEIQWNRQVKEVLGTDKVEGVLLESTVGEDDVTVPADGFFMAIGHKPNTDLFKGQLHLDEAGYIVPEGEYQTYTNVPGVFVAGDVFDHRYRQAITAAGSGCKAAIDAERWLEDQA